MALVSEIVLGEVSPGYQRIKEFLIKINNDFNPPLSKKVSLDSYSKKLNQKAKFICAYKGEELIGMTVFYANDPHRIESYLPIIGVVKEYRGYGLAYRMLNSLISYLRKNNYERLALETWHGSPAQIFYQKNNFIIDKIVDDREGKTKSVKMFRWVGDIKSESDSIESSDLQYNKKLSKELGIELFVKRDDLYPKFGGGNKARKLDYILNKARNSNCNALVTAGGAQSNHCRATAQYAASLGWKLVAIIHDEEPHQYEGNLKLMKLSGAELRFVKKSEVKLAMDEAMNDLKMEGYKPYYIWGGGHSLEGALAFYDAVKELKIQLGNTMPDYLFVPSGTGATQAGLEVGIRQFYPKCMVIGVSVAREEKRGTEEILDTMNELNKYLDYPIKAPKKVNFNTRECGVGYESTFPELIDIIHRCALKGLVLDPTYTGKAFYVLQALVEKGKIPKNSKVLFWHTGGLMNLISSIDI